MGSDKIDKDLMKNILDINYTKYVQYKTTAVIIGFTYIVGIIIIFITKQLDFSNKNQMITLIIFSVITLTPCIYTVLNSQKHISKIPELISKLE